jgi:XTP/dITP diphosphohydrolase
VPHDTAVEETGATYSENARLKAEAAVAETGLPALGDDSGLEVEALDGFPGLHSARLAPTQVERTAELLNRLRTEPRPWRAKFVSVIALARPGGETTFHRGEVPGEIVPDWRGEAGFGYDPVFMPAGATQTFGEMEAGEKHRWSHRAAAVRALLASGELATLT